MPGGISFAHGGGDDFRPTEGVGARDDEGEGEGEGEGEYTFSAACIEARDTERAGAGPGNEATDGGARAAAIEAVRLEGLRVVGGDGRFALDERVECATCGFLSAGSGGGDRFCRNLSASCGGSDLRKARFAPVKAAASRDCVC